VGVDDGTGVRVGVRVGGTGVELGRGAGGTIWQGSQSTSSAMILSSGRQFISFNRDTVV
jgi:hypothetical protein